MSTIALEQPKVYKRKISSKNQVTIPRSIGKRFGMNPNSQIFFKEENGRLFIETSEMNAAAPQNNGLYIDQEIILDLLEANQYKQYPERADEESLGDFCTTNSLLSSL